MKPNKHELNVITFFALIPLVYFIPPQLARFLGGNHLLITIGAVGIIVPILAYIIMPIVLKIRASILKKTQRILQI